MRLFRALAMGMLLPAILLLLSCRPDPRKSFETLLGPGAEVLPLAEGDRALFERVLPWTEALARAGWDIPAEGIYYYGEARLALGWETLADGKVTPVWGGDIPQGSDVPAKPLYHLPPSERRSPLMGPFADTFAQRELLHWLCVEAVSRQFGEDGELTAYLAYRTTGALLYSRLGPGSGEWQDFRAESHDDRVWAQLTLDLQKQLGDLKTRADGDPDLEYAELREKLYRSWLRDYNFRYDERFLTNRWLDFGKGILSDRELNQLDLSPARRPDLDRKFAGAGEDLGKLYEMATRLDAPGDT